MQLPSCLVVAAIVAFGATAVPTKRNSGHWVLISRYTVPFYQAASNLKNVSTYHALTRVEGSLGQPRGGVYRRRPFEQDGLSPTTSYNKGQAFYTSVKFGTQTFNLLVDTGSADTWLAVEGAQCIDAMSGEAIEIGSPGCTFLGPLWDKSGCVPIPDENFNIAYGGNMIDQGTFCTIDVTMGGITAKNQQVAAVTKVGFGGDAPTSGVVGFGYPSLTFGYHGTNFSADNHGTNQAPYDPLFTTMYKQNQIPPVFSMALSRASLYRTNDGFIALGGLAPVITYGDWGVTPIEYVALNGGGFYLPSTLPYPQYQWYTITPDAFLFQSNDKIIYNPSQWVPLPAPDSLQPSNVGEGQYVLDSGATQVYLPTIMSNALAAKFNPPAVWNTTIGQYAVPCNAKAPWFAIQISGVIFPVDKRDMIIDDGTRSGTCAAGMNDGGTNNAPYTIGDTFMNNAMVVFDVGSGEMKFRSRGYYL